MNIFPGKSIFSPPKPKDPVALPDPVDKGAVSEEARRKAQADAKRRRGRKSSILTSAQGVEDEAVGSLG